MFTLRNYNEYGEENQYLGKRYTLISKERNRKYFDENMIRFMGEDFMSGGEAETIGNKIFAFISAEITIPLYKDQVYYIVSDNGNTYSTERFK